MKVNFKTTLLHAERTIKSNLRNFDVNYSILFNKVKDYMESNPNLSDDEIEEKLDEYIYNIADELLNVQLIKNENLQYNTFSFLKNNPDRFEYYYNKNKDSNEIKKFEKEQQLFYSSNTENNIKISLYDVISFVRNINSPDMNKAYEEYKQGNSNSSYKNSRFQVAMKIKEFSEGKKEIDVTKYAIDQFQKLFEDSLNKKYINNLDLIIGRLNSLNALDVYINRHNGKYQYWGLDSLSLTLNYNKETGETGLLEKLNDKNLETLSPHKLSILTAFWTNRYLKEMTQINDAYFAIKTMNLIPKIRQSSRDENKNVIVNLDDKQKEVICEKNALLTNLIKRVYEDFDYQIKINETQGKKVNLDKQIEGYVEKELQKINRQVGFDYKVYFDQKSKIGRNFILDDIKACNLSQQLVAQLYGIKDTQMMVVLENLYANPKLSDNWGIIIEDDYEPKNSKILIGVDIEGFNMPLRLHCSYNDLVDFLRSKENDTKIRYYFGGRDFSTESSHISTNVLFPLSKKQTEYLKSNKENSNFVEHLKYLANAKDFPEHLKEKRFEKKKIQVGGTRNNPKYQMVNESIKVKPDIKYYDIENDKFYKKENDKYIPLDNEKGIGVNDEIER